MAKIEIRTISVYPFRLSAQGPEYLTLHRHAGDRDFGNVWMAVHGRIKRGETATEAAVRETKEETGLAPIGFWSLDFVEHFYVPSIDAVEIVPCFAAQLEGNVTLNGEHDEHRWQKYDEIEKFLIWRGQREAIQILHEEIATPLFERRPINPYLAIRVRRRNE
jgi:dATP pyrophosphohydrolase